MLHRGYRFWREMVTQLNKQNISAFAASTAFFFFLSIVPMLVMVCTIIPYTPLTEANLAMAITELTPDAMDALAEGLIAEVYEKSAGILSIAIIATIWSAGKGVMALMRGLNVISEVEEDRNYFVVRIVSSFYTLVMLLVVILSLFIMVFGNQLVEIALYRIPQLKVVVSFAMNFRFVFVWIVLSILFAMMYAYIPNEKLKFREQLTGAMFSAIAWSVFSWGFSLYVSRAGAYSIYGSLSIIILVMIWMYVCMYIIMIGAYLNRYFMQINKKSEH